MGKPQRNLWTGVGRYTSLAFVLPSCVVVGYAIGYFLDKAFGTSFLYIVFLLLGIAAGFIELIREVQRDPPDGPGPKTSFGRDHSTGRKS